MSRNNAGKFGQKNETVWLIMLNRNNRMSFSWELSHRVHPGRHGHDEEWSQQGSGTVLEECDTIPPQGSPPIHVGLMEAENAGFGASPDSPTNVLCD